MNANIVYTIVKALSEKEQLLLYDLLKKDIFQNTTIPKKKEVLITRSESDAFILKTIFFK